MIPPKLLVLSACLLSLALLACAPTMTQEPAAPVPIVDTGETASPTKDEGKLVQDEQDKHAAIAEALAKLDVKMMDALSADDGVANILSSGEVPAGLLDSHLSQGSGVATGGLAVGPGGGGSAMGAGSSIGAIRSATLPQGKVTVDAVAVVGKVDNAGAVVARMKGRFTRCYRNSLRTHPGAAGQAALTATIDGSGVATHIASTQDASLASTRPCLEAVLASGGFSPAEGGSADLKIDLNFVPGP